MKKFSMPKINVEHIKKVPRWFIDHKKTTLLLITGICLLLFIFHPWTGGLPIFYEGWEESEHYTQAYYANRPGGSDNIPDNVKFKVMINPHEEYGVIRARLYVSRDYGATWIHWSDGFIRDGTLDLNRWN